MFIVDTNQERGTPYNLQISDETDVEEKDAFRAFPKLRFKGSIDTVLVAKINDIVVGAIFTRTPDERRGEISTVGYFGAIHISKKYKFQEIERELLVALLCKEKEKGKTHLQVEAKGPGTVSLADLDRTTQERIEDFLDRQKETLSFFLSIHNTTNVAMTFLSTVNITRAYYHTIQYDLSTLST